MIMLTTVVIGLVLWKGMRPFDTPWHLRMCMLVSPLGFSIITSSGFF